MVQKTNIEDKKNNLRTRHDFFYFLIATRYLLNYKHLFEETFQTKTLDSLGGWLEKLNQSDIKSMKDDRINELSRDNNVNEVITNFFGLRTFGSMVIVYSALCLESLINDYCVFRKSSTYFKNHIDKLDTPSKWLLVPKIITNKEISSDSETYELIKDLYSLRNSLVHPKSKEVDIDSDDNIIKNELGVSLFNKTKRSYLAIVKATNALYNIDRSFKHLEDYKFLWDKNGDFNNISDVYSFYSSFYSSIDIEI